MEHQTSSKSSQNTVYQTRCLIAYWILGLSNNFGYVVMLTAASTIIEKHESAMQSNNERHCTYMSTGTILLADIIPAMMVKIIGSFLPFYVHARVCLCIVLAAMGFVLVALSENTALTLTGVILTALTSGLGEITFLQYSSFYKRNVISSWSSGTGGAGIVGSLSFAMLSHFGLKTTLLMMISVPILMGISFWIILPTPTNEVVETIDIQRGVNEAEIKEPIKIIIEKIRFLPHLLVYMVPIGFVYFFEYLINQGTFELMHFENDIIAIKDQYMWLQVDYQVGVFLSRSSVNIVQVKHVWVMSILQFLNVILFMTEAIYYYLPRFWIVLVVTLWEGLLGGAAYVNTFYRLSNEIAEEKKQFALAVTSFADSVGITMAGICSIYVHNFICSLPLTK